MNHKQVMRRALEQLKINRTNFRKGPSKSICKMLAGGNDEVIADLESALAEPVQEPVFEIGFGWLEDAITYPRGTKLYTAPPQRKPLTEEEIDKIADHLDATVIGWSTHEFTREIERAHEIGE